jgi:hypothetical protein
MPRPRNTCYQFKTLVSYRIHGRHLNGLPPL